MWRIFDTVMRIVSSLIGLAMILMGVVWILQGLNLAFRVGFMVGNYHWTIYGAILALIGVAQVFWSNTRQTVVNIDIEDDLPAEPPGSVGTPSPQPPEPGPEHPTSNAASGLCSAAIGLFAIIVAFIGYTGYSGTGAGPPWGLVDLFHLVPAGVAAIALVSVPWIATKPESKTKKGDALEVARMVFLVGGICTILSLGIFIGRDVHHSLTQNQRESYGPWPQDVATARYQRQPQVHRQSGLKARIVTPAIAKILLVDESFESAQL
jgi:hypothetical protein